MLSYAVIYHFTELCFSLLSPERAVNLSNYSKIKAYSFHYFAQCSALCKRERSQGLPSQLKWTPAEDSYTWICFCAPMINQEPYKNVQQYGKRLFNIHTRLCLWVSFSMMKMLTNFPFDFINVSCSNSIVSADFFPLSNVLSPKKNTEWSSFCYTECFFKQKANYLIIPS